ncbi:hypothetical protein [Sorangium sp. So ce388]|uniref:hypothetical protein n=1 Tax=Sorangium sp. So ce388 TaxID=3133309 RepID=UPI003F5B7659
MAKSLAEQIQEAAAELARQTSTEPSLRALADAAKVDYNNLTRAARGAVVPSTQTLSAIATAVPGVRFILEAGVEIGSPRPVYPTDQRRTTAAAKKPRKRA